MRPRTGLEKWVQIIQSMRVAGSPRSVTAAKHVVVLTDFAADTSVDKTIRVAAKAKIQWLLNCAAYQETVWLDQTQLKKYLAEFRANGYAEPAGYEWHEDRESNPHPYHDNGR
jgi:hypothetical protein